MEIRTDKVIAVALHLGAFGMCIAVGVEGDDLFGLLIPAMGSWIAGLRLWSRGAVALPPPVETPRPADGHVARLEERLAALQEDVARLRENREFFENLYGGGASQRAIRERNTVERP